MRSRPIDWIADALIAAVLLALLCGGLVAIAGLGVLLIRLV